jgi:hypothetical protein
MGVVKLGAEVTRDRVQTMTVTLNPLEEIRYLVE